MLLNMKYHCLDILFTIFAKWSSGVHSLCMDFLAVTVKSFDCRNDLKNKFISMYLVKRKEQDIETFFAIRVILSSIPLIRHAIGLILALKMNLDRTKTGS